MRPFRGRRRREEVRRQRANEAGEFLEIDGGVLSSLRGADTFGVTLVDKLTSLDARSLVSFRQQLLISRAPLLTELDLSSLSSVFLGSIFDCPMLSECVVADVNAQLAPESNWTRGSGLRSDPSCMAP